MNDNPRNTLRYPYRNNYCFKCLHFCLNGNKGSCSIHRGDSNKTIKEIVTCTQYRLKPTINFIECKEKPNGKYI